jgi:hypothetical protein
MASIIKADNIQKVSDGSNIIKKCGSTTTIGSGACSPIVICGSTVTLGRCGGTVTLASGATQTGFGRTGTVDWCTTAKTAPFTGVSGNGYFVNTTSGVVTVTLPATPTAGDIISIADYASTFQTNNLTICNNSSKINGQCANASLSTQGQSITLVYVDATKGWKTTMDSTSDVTGGGFITATGGTIVTCGDYKTHIFTSTGTFCVSLGGGPLAVVDYFVVAGGGGGGTNGYGGAGAGAGGFRVSNSYLIAAPTMSPLSNPATISSLTPGSYPVTVGAGGSGNDTPSPSSPLTGNPGSNSVFSTITSAGGGGGGGAAPAFPLAFGLPGGSGGGSSPACASGGSGNTPPVSPPQGQNGGTGSGSGVRGGGGGGGAGAVGSNSPGATVGGPGGIGSYIADTFMGPTAPSYGESGPVSSTRYFAGGGGGSNESTGTKGTGGIGGGGDGYQNASGPGCAGVANTGGGGGGSGVPYAGATGGSGIVMIRYKFQ